VYYSDAEEGDEFIPIYEKRKRREVMMEQIRYRNLSGWLKLGVSMGILQALILAASFVFFMIAIAIG